MNNSVEVRFRWTADELIKATRAHLCARYSLTTRVLFFCLASALFLFGVYTLTHSGPDPLGITSAVVGAVFLLMFPVLLPRRLRRDFAKRPDRNSDVAWTIRDTGLANKTTLGDSNVTWSAFVKVVQTGDGFLLYPVSQIFHWLPRHGFVNDADYQRAAELARAHATLFVQNCKRAVFADSQANNSI
jgi:hypothetical protein